MRLILSLAVVLWSSGDLMAQSCGYGGGYYGGGYYGGIGCNGGSYGQSCSMCSGKAGGGPYSYHGNADKHGAGFKEGTTYRFANGKQFIYSQGYFYPIGSARTGNGNRVPAPSHPDSGEERGSTTEQKKVPAPHHPEFPDTNYGGNNNAVWIKIRTPDGEIYTAPVVNGFMPEPYMKNGERRFRYEYRIPYTNSRRQDYENNGYIQYHEGTEELKEKHRKNTEKVAMR